jgi:hypothetical protein
MAEEEKKSTMKTVITSIVLGVSLVTGVFAVNDRFATAADVKKLETKFVQTLEQFQANQEMKNDTRRYTDLTDQAMTMKNMVRKNPNDKGLKEDYEAVERNRQELKKKLEAAK